MADLLNEPRAKRPRVDKVGRFAALEKLRKLKGSKHKYEVEEDVDNVYEIVDEREYAKKAKERYGDDWIEDDGTGYAEDGRDFFEEEDDYSDDDDGPSSSKNHNKNSKKRPRDGDKPTKSKGSIRNLFSKVVPKKAAPVSLKDDDILADILGEINDDKPAAQTNINDAVAFQKVIAPAKIIATKKSNAALAKEYMNSFINNLKMPEKENPTEKDKSDDELIESVLKPKSLETNKKVSVQLNKVKKLDAEANKDESIITTRAEDVRKISSESKITANESKLENTIDFPDDDDDMDFSCLNDVENQFELEKTKKAKEVENSKETAKVSPPKVSKPEKSLTEAEDLKNLLNNWENICQTENFEEEMNTSISDTHSLPVDGIFKFWYWEAWEDAKSRPGEVFLFGRTSEGKSVCVRVEKIERSLYLLPRKFLLDPISKEATKQKVTVADIYKEFDDDISTELKLDGFRSRKVTKNFGNHAIGIDVPQVCDYMEVHYDYKKPPPNLKKKYNSIAHIFGANTTALECFLLDRKIKGPCWLTLKQFKINSSPMGWCKLDITVSEPRFVLLTEELKPPPPPPLTMVTLNVRTAYNPKTSKNEVCMIGILVHNRFHIDRPAPQPAFNRHMCGITRPVNTNWPFDLNAKVAKFKSTRLYKHDSERSLLSWFLAQYQQIDADLVVTFDAYDCQLDILADRIINAKIMQWSRLSRLRLSQHIGRKLTDFFVGRMMCDVKRSAEECIRARSYDLQTLCQTVLKIKENERMDVNNEDLVAMYATSDGIIKLISLTMQDASYVLRLMYELNIMPLALQITNICGNIMTRTLQGGRSERNEFLLLHAFTEKNYIVPDKKKKEWGENKNPVDDGEGGMDNTNANATNVGRKKAAYSGGLVLDPIRGLYEKFILLMDFNSLYPSIIQEYNICFTTVQQPYNLEDLPELPDSSIEQGILPQQLRRLVESRREVKKLMAASDLSPELKMQYHIRQMALKLTANSMYGCLGFAQSRFFAQHLAALVTNKGREILLNTKTLVQKLNYDVVYGDTDSIMVNTNITDYDQVMKIGQGIKLSVNKLYKQLELDIDGVFSCLLLLKKKKYAAVKVCKGKKGELLKEQEHKGLDIVRRDWSQIAVMVGKLVLDEILAEKPLDEKLEVVHSHLEKIKTQVLEGSVPMAMFIITKQLSRHPTEFKSAISQSHVQVALRMNKTRNRRYKKGDMVDYIICEDGTNNPATQRAYHLDEIKGSESLKLDTNYYLAHQIHPVVTRMVEVLEGTDASRIAECLGLDPSKFKASVQRNHEERSEDVTGETIVKTTLQRYRMCEKFVFTCVVCKTDNTIAAAFRPAGNVHEPVLQKCSNRECVTAPYQYVIGIRNSLQLTIRTFIERFYLNWLVCDNPSCNRNTRLITYVALNNRPVCLFCKTGTLVRQYSERDLHTQLCYFQYIFDLSKSPHKPTNLLPELEAAYSMLKETVDQVLEKSAYCVISLSRLFAGFLSLDQRDEISFKPIGYEVSGEEVAVSLDDE